MPPLPPVTAIARLIKLGVGATAAVYFASNCLFNVDGGHRAVVFNRLTGIKDKASHGLRMRIKISPIPPLERKEIDEFQTEEQLPPSIASHWPSFPSHCVQNVTRRTSRHV